LTAAAGAPPFISRQERFASVGSTNDIVRSWLADGTPEVCLAVADEQTAGRGRAGRTWSAPPNRALLLSLGFRPAWLAPEHAWRLAAIVSLAMADAAEEAAGLKDRLVRLKWPNDLVVETSAGSVLKLAGVLGETDGLGSGDPHAIVGIGVNADWPAAEFPPDLAAGMTSLREASGGRPIDLVLLLDAFLSRLEVRVAALRAGRFDHADWTERQLTTGRIVDLHVGDGVVDQVRAVGVDGASGALIVEDDAAPGGERAVIAGEIHRVRLASPERAGV
jgi:BirA family biotin operon repressor/biotin-[acetyl-CoA-carboxylase] ligase